MSVVIVVSSAALPASVTLPTEFSADNKKPSVQKFLERQVGPYSLLLKVWCVCVCVNVMVHVWKS